MNMRLISSLFAATVVVSAPCYAVTALELVNDMTAVFNETATLAGTVKDTDTANAAAPKLVELTTRLKKITAALPTATNTEPKNEEEKATFTAAGNKLQAASDAMQKAMDAIPGTAKSDAFGKAMMGYGKALQELGQTMQSADKK